MKNIQIPCVIKYEIKDGKINSQLVLNLPKTFDFNKLKEILNDYEPTIVTREEEIEILKKITDMLLMLLKKK